jgi:hypothetical protein
VDILIRMNRLLAVIASAVALIPHTADAQSPWYARDRWQLELATGAVVFECQLRERVGDNLLVSEGDSLRSLPLATLTGMRLLHPAAKTVGGGARSTFGALAGPTMRYIS